MIVNGKYLYRVLCVLVLGVYALGGTVNAATYTGNCGENGDNVTYTLNTSTGVLTISGTGAMEDYSYFTSSLSPSPWDIHRSYIKTLVVNSGVTELGNFAFYNLYNLTSVSLPTSVTLIPFYGFAKCSALASITIPSSVTNIGNYAFRECTSLTSISIPSNAVNLGSYIFQDCSNLKNATFGTGITIIPVGCFVRCPMTDFTIPTHITRLNQEAFLGCSFTTMTIPSTVKSWGREVFEDCVSLTDLYVQWTTSIPQWDDYNTLVAGTTNAKIHVPCGTSDAYRAKGWGTQLIVAGDGVRSGTCGASGDDVKWVFDCDGVLSVYGTGAMADWSRYEDIPWNDYRSSIKKVTMGPNVTTLGKIAFAQCENLTSVTIGNGVKTIKKQAFYDCAKLDSVVIPNGVTEIVELAFYKCPSLQYLILGSGLQTIGQMAFMNCGSLRSVSIPSSVSSLGPGVWNLCDNLHHLTVAWTSASQIPNWNNLVSASPCYLHVPCGTYDIYHSANGWKNCGISEVIYGECGAEGQEANVTWTLSCDSVLTVSGTGAMTNKQAWSAVRGAIKTAIIGNGITNIGNSAFSQCTKLTSVTIGKGVTSIGTNAFYACRKMESVHITDLAAWCGISYGDSYSYPFYKNGNAANKGDGNIYLKGTLLTELSIPQGISEIKPYAFYGCTSINSISSFGEVTSIGNCAFAHCSGLSSVTIPEGVTSTGNFSFGGCASLQSASLPASLTTIGARLFESCEDLADIFVRWEGDIPVWPNNFTNKSGINLHIPCGLAEIYRYADGWNNYTIVEDIPFAVSGTCGEGVNWELNACDGVLTLSGDGELAEYAAGEEPWHAYANVIDTIYVPCGKKAYYQSALPDYAERIGYVRCEQYVIDFVNWDGELLQSSMVDRETLPSYNGAMPQRETDEQYKYVFCGWTPKVVIATNDAIYTATYLERDKTEGIEEVESGKSKVGSRKILRDGHLYIRRGEKIYTVLGTETK